MYGKLKKIPQRLKKEWLLVLLGTASVFASSMYVQYSMYAFFVQIITNNMPLVVPSFEPLRPSVHFILQVCAVYCMYSLYIRNTIILLYHTCHSQSHLFEGVSFVIF